MYGKGKIELLIDKTFDELNVDCAKLHIGSHQKVYVKCSRCGEVFLREYRNINQLHACPMHIIRNDGVKLKWCNKCEKFLSYKCFNKNSVRYDKLSSICKVCTGSMPNSKRKHSKMKKDRLTADGWFKWIVSTKKSVCKKNGMDFDIDVQYLKNQYDEQCGLCFYSKTKLEFGISSLRSASLERLDSSKGYIKNNVVIASKAMNWAKNKFPEHDFITFLLDMINGLSKYVRLESKIIHEDGRLPFRKRTTDAGYDVYSAVDVTIPPRSNMSIDTGIIVSPPDGTYYSIEGRSSLWSKGIVPCTGIIDGTYQGPLKVVLINYTDEPYNVMKGDRIAQLILHQILHGDFAIVDEFSPIDNARGDQGFGSSGR